MDGLAPRHVLYMPGSEDLRGIRSQLPTVAFYSRTHLCWLPFPPCLTFPLPLLRMLPNMIYTHIFLPQGLLLRISTQDTHLKDKASET